jgi:hypothetical protein
MKLKIINKNVFKKSKKIKFIVFKLNKKYNKNNKIFYPKNY